MNKILVGLMGAALACTSLTACAGTTATTSSATSSTMSPVVPSFSPSTDPSVTSSLTPIGEATGDNATPTAAPATDSSADATEASTSSESEPSSTSTPVVLDPSRAGQELGLQDFPFQEGTWRDGVFSVDSANVTGVATMLSSCYDSNASSLQMRLGRRFSRLTFTVGQGNSGESMKDRVLVKIEANGRAMTPKSVTFVSPSEFSVDVKDVNGLQLTFGLDPEVQNCGQNGSVQAVMYKIIAHQ